MHLVHVITTDLAGTIQMGEFSISVRALIMSVLTIAVVMIALTLPFPHGKGAITPHGEEADVDGTGPVGRSATRR
ncbi:hypothetical protein OEB99_00105 [Actinotalea sp. M2MS4P-6]|uniref:hypothetical protein n=1 Tax=Actinotalea sp. M2MS4P-6 TaxID=2983762 RepID=UPI0021E4952A|nr:hypothetical protein [Actinotalea sp. M2MS4P-6]MCV2392699.1 hypothetical protein [Actinotalea sp. M2MS4P-6]